MSFSGQIYPKDTVGYFRVASTDNTYPIVPVALGEFLIGRGAHCHLRFGDSSIPDVHTLLSIDRDIVLLHSAVADPPIYVNGTPETECRLEDGDLIELGEFRMLFRLAASDQRITLDESEFDCLPAARAFHTASKTTLEEQVVDRLEEQIELVEELAHTPDRGIAELLSAVAGIDAAKLSPTPLEEEELPSASRELQQITAMMRRQHEASRVRLESLTAVLDNVVSQQKLIADTLQVLSDRVQAIDATAPYGQRRASA